ncbi:MAG: threonylcarbamoyl-AMP synthase [Candidatus Levybacteria bacterium]|nr:threonylcarbamoyl-AMP synthase [Candidatus Levybacteria bacterium]
MNSLEEAIKVVRQGGIIIFPTDTAFGIGCRMDNEKAVKRLFEIKKRPREQAVPVLFDNASRVEEFVLPFDSVIKKLMKKYWPGALTIVLPCKTSKVNALVRGGGKTLGVRIPDHKVPMELIKGANVPILAPSANFHGEKTPYIFEELDKALLKRVDFVIEGEAGGSLSSTVVDCSRQPWEIIRQGAILLDL